MKSPPDESCPESATLAEQMGDPSGPTAPVDPTETALQALGFVGVSLVALGCLVVPLSARVHPTMGATRSARLEWQRRQAQIEQALAQQEAQRPAFGLQSTSDAEQQERSGTAPQ